MGRGCIGGALGCLGILIAGAIAVAVWATLAAPVGTPVLGNLRYNCTVGAVPTNLTVTINGPLSGRECQHLLDQTSLLPVQLLKTVDAPTGSVICTFDQRYTTVTIRASGLLTFAGNQFCSLVQQILKSTLSSRAPGVAHAAASSANEVTVRDGGQTLRHS